MQFFLPSLVFLPLVLLSACNGDDAKTDDSTTVPEDSDSPTTEDSETVAPVATAVDVACTPTSVTTRDVATCTATATWDDGTTSDVTAETTWISGDDAVGSVYVPGIFQPLTVGEATVTGAYEAFSGEATITVTGVAPAAPGDLAFNEVLADGYYDANGDGTLDAVQDEFLEIANVGTATVDLSGATLTEAGQPEAPRHTFAMGTVLQAGQAIVVFGGGTLDALGGSNVTYVTAVNEDSGLVLGLALNNEGDTLTLTSATGEALATMAYGTEDVEAETDGSMNLDPDLDGTTWVPHKYAEGAVGNQSPGTLVDGSPFPGPGGRYRQ